MHAEAFRQTVLDDESDSVTLDDLDRRPRDAAVESPRVDDAAWNELCANVFHGDVEDLDTVLHVPRHLWHVRCDDLRNTRQDLGSRDHRVATRANSARRSGRRRDRVTFMLCGGGRRSASGAGNGCQSAQKQASAGLHRTDSENEFKGAQRHVSLQRSGGYQIRRESGLDRAPGGLPVMYEAEKTSA